MKTIYLEDLKSGDEFWSGEFTVEAEEMLDYNRRFDPWPMHVDEAAARRGPFGGLIASGGYTLSLMYRSGHAIYKHGDTAWAFLVGLDWKVKFLLPVRPGDRLRNRISIQDKRPSSKPGRGVVFVRNEMFNQEQQLVLQCDMVLLVATRPGETQEIP